MEVQSVQELTESWVNGNRQDVADYLSAAHPAAAAVLAVYWFNRSDALWADYRNTLVLMLKSREFAAVSRG